MIRIAIVEDEVEVVTELRSFLQRYSTESGEKLEIVEFHNGVELLENYRPCYDIILMDIMMPYIDGMEAAERLREMDEKVVLIFVTNMAQFAVKGYEVSALSFIVKPVKYHAFSMSMRRAINHINRSRSDFISVNTENGWRRISTDDILYLEVIGHNIYIYLTSGKERIKKNTLTALENQLVPYGFARCNSGFLVNLKKIRTMTAGSLLIGNTEIRIARGRKKDFLRQVMQYAERRK